MVQCKELYRKKIGVYAQESARSVYDDRFVGLLYLFESG
jgi:hypothetical protein